MEISQTRAAYARRKGRGLRRRIAAGFAAVRNRPIPDGIPASKRRDMSDFDSIRRLLAFGLGPADSGVDIGAHRGSVLAEMVRVAPQGRHIAFEPIPDLAAFLRAQFPDVEVRQAAAYREAGSSEFAHVQGVAEGWSGLKFRPIPGDEQHVQVTVEPLVVALEALDDVLAPDFAPKVIKIDVEGAELPVLQGALRTLSTHRPTVIFEHGSGSAELYDSGPAELFAFFAALSYRIWDLDGNGPYSAEAFERSFRSAERVNWVATP